MLLTDLFKRQLLPEYCGDFIKLVVLRDSLKGWKS